MSIDNFNKVYYAIDNISRRGEYLGLMNVNEHLASQISPVNYYYDKISKESNLELFTIDNKPSSDMDYETLLKLAEQSHYGDLILNKTCLNENVRKSYEISNNDSERVKFTDKGQQFMDNYMKNVSRLLFNNKSVKLKIDKFNIYGQNMFFNSHQDTPRDNVMGTVVCIFPTTCSGGEFVLCDERFKVIPDEYQFIAFYGYKKHEISQIWKGARYSVSMFILLDESHEPENPEKESDQLKDELNEPDEPDKLEEEPDEDQDEPEDEPEDEPDEDQGESDEEDGENSALENDSLSLNISDVKHILKEYSNRKIGIVLDNKYSNYEIANKLFMGVDGDLYNLLNENNINILVQPVLLVYNAQKYRDNPDYNYEICRVYKFAEQDIDAIWNGVSNKKRNPYKEDIVFIGYCKNNIYREHEDYIEYTGNDSRPESIDNYYYQVSLIIDPSENNFT